MKRIYEVPMLAKVRVVTVVVDEDRDACEFANLGFEVDGRDVYDPAGGFDWADEDAVIDITDKFDEEDRRELEKQQDEILVKHGMKGAI